MAQEAPPKAQEPPETDDTERTRLPSLFMTFRYRTLQVLRFLAPALCCVVLYAALFFADLASGTDLAVFGVRDAATEQRVYARYGAFIYQEQLRILLCFALLGLVVGLCAQAVALWWDRVGHPDRRPTLLRRTLMTVGLAGCFHLWQGAHAIARFPQLFTESLYDRGGARRALMLALTHYIPAPLVDGLAIGAICGLVLGPLLTPQGRHQVRVTWPRLRHRLFGTLWGRLLILASACALCLMPLLPRLAGRDLDQGPVQDHVQGQEETSAAPSAAPAGSRPPSVLILAVDSLRADRVGPAARAVAPHIAALADRSVRFESAFVTVPRTFPSFVTLLTGRYPHHHGIRTMFPSASERAQVGPALPAVLRKGGFQTAVLSDFCGEIFSRIDLGFGQVRVPSFDVKTIVRQRSVTVHPNLLPYVDGVWGRRIFPSLESLAELSDPDLLASRAITSLKEKARGKRPFFMTVFFSSAHFPYAAPAPYYRRFTDPDYRGPFRYHKPPWADSAMTEEDEAQVRGLYNGAVAASDAAIGRVLRALTDLGLSEDTIVVLLADHGENLYDHAGRGMGHGDHLEGAHAMQIPLLIHDPVHRFPPHTVPGIVRDIDLAPTLMQLLGLPAKALPADGVSLLPMLKGERQDLGLRAFSETELWFTPAGPGFDPDNRLPYPGVTATTDVDPSDDIFLSERWRDLVTVAKHRALRTSEWKLIYRPTRTGVHWTLYDLKKDPMETRDVAGQHPRELAALQADLLRFLANDPKAVVEGGYVIPQ
jgi:arylsulfatase A-like enzyme